MNFYDTVVNMGYTIKEKNKEKISIERKEENSNTVIVFELNSKKIFGYLFPTSPVTEIENVSHIFYCFKKMKQDLQELSNLSGYDIIK